MGSATDESKPTSLSSKSMPPTRWLFVILANNRGPDVSIVDVVPSHHCGTLSPLCIASTENNTIDTLCMCNAPESISAMYTKKFPLSHLLPYCKQRNWRFESQVKKPTAHTYLHKTTYTHTHTHTTNTNEYMTRESTNQLVMNGYITYVV